MTRQLLIWMQLLTGILHHFFRYDTTTTDGNAIKNFILVATNLHYSWFEEHVEGFSPLLISNTPEDPVFDTHYEQYSELVADSRPTSDRNCYKKDAFDVDANNDGGAMDNRLVDNNDDQRGGNNQNSDGDYVEKQRESGYLRKDFFWIKFDLPP